MKLEVHIIRLASGVLTAHVNQGNQYGKNLLSGRSITKVESAKEAIKARLWTELRPIELEIQWKIIA